MGRALAALILWAGIVFSSTAFAGTSCTAGRVGVSTQTAMHAFNVEVADTEALRATGLMNRPQMASSAGMLFVYPRPVHAQFWMANTLISLDIIFAGVDGTVKKVHENAVPLDRSLIDGGDGVQFVLEINGGLARRLGITPGARLHHPAIAGSDCAPA